MRTPSHRRRAVAIIGLAAAASIAITQGPATAAAPPEPEGVVVNKATHPVPGSYVVTLTPNRSLTSTAIEKTAKSLVDKHGGRVNSVLTATMQGFVVKDLSAKDARRLAAEPGVAEVRQSGTARIGGAYDQAGAYGAYGAYGPGGTQSNPQNWGLDRIDQRDRPLDSKYTYPNDGAGVNVYIVDTGIRYTHQEFGGRAKFGVDLHASPNQGNDCHNHGTHVAGIAAGTTRGVAKKANLISVRILGCDGRGEDAGLIEAAEWITKNAVKPAVVNLSVYTDDRDIAVNAIKSSISAGIQWSLITGNNGGNACNYGPGGPTPEALQVANSTNQDTRAFDSNAGTCMDLFAPGSGIDSAFKGSDTSYGQLSGTSMAAPHVAGAMALRLSEVPGSTPAELHQWVMDNASTGKMSGLASGVPNKLLYLPNTPTNPTDPVAKFTASCPTGGLACSFDASASSDPDGSIASYAWAFGDSTSGDGKTVNHTYGAAGTYTVKLTVTDNSGKTASTEQQVRVGDSGGGQAPTAAFTVNCQAGLNCAFDAAGSRDPDGSIVTYAWDFGDGAQGNGVKVTHAYPSKSTTYTAKLTVTDNSGKTGTTSKRVQCWSFGSGQGFCFAN